jgi:hypothetical protein
MSFTADREDFENSGEKNKRGSVDLYMFTVGVSTFLCNGNALTLSRLPQFPRLIGDFTSQTTNICDFQQRLPVII